MLFAGMTCSALTAGVMALGLRIGEIEGSWWRVLRMVFLILTGGPAFDDSVNKFNRSMNRGGELAAWFAGQFGSTQCREITGADFSSTAEVEAYLQGSGITKCQLIAQMVADHVQLMLEEGSEKKEPRRQALRVAKGSGSGSVKTKRLPLPSPSLSAHIVPPCSSTSLRDRESPSPEP